MHRTNYASHLRTTPLPLTLAAMAVALPASAQAAAIGWSPSSRCRASGSARLICTRSTSSAVGARPGARPPPGHASA